MAAIDPRATQAACHPACIACRPKGQGGLGLSFTVQPDDSLVATFDCHPIYQGYPDRLHGGVIATLLDAAMTHCLFSRGIQGYTGRLNLRFRKPVLIGQPVQIRAWLVRSMHPLYALKAELRQVNVCATTAEARFYGSLLGEPDDDDSGTGDNPV